MISIAQAHTWSIGYTPTHKNTKAFYLGMVHWVTRSSSWRNWRRNLRSGSRQNFPSMSLSHYTLLACQEAN